MRPPKRTKNEAYKRFVRNCRCAACNAPAPSDPHHLESGPMGAKSDDRTCVPLCRECHDIFHSRGQRELEEKYNVNLWRQAHRVLRLYIDETEPIEGTEPK